MTIRRFPLLSATRADGACEEDRAGGRRGQEADDRLEPAPLVHWACRDQGRGVDLVDLVQEGTFGLMRGVEKFDWRKGFRVLHLRYLVDPPSPPARRESKGRAIRLPQDVLASELEGDPDHGRPPRVVASLDQPLTSEATATLGDVVSGDEPPFEDEIARTLTLREARRRHRATSGARARALVGFVSALTEARPRRSSPPCGRWA